MSAGELVELILRQIERRDRKATEQQRKREPSYTAFFMAAATMGEAWQEVVAEFGDDFVKAGDLLASAKMPAVRKAWQDAQSKARHMAAGTPEAVKAAHAVVDKLRDPQVAPYLDQGPAAIEALRQRTLLDVEVCPAAIARELDDALEAFAAELSRDLGLE
ncbi:MAG TPA: hypothetical protein VHF47_03260 [Acidimicrobiales bacterium]|nr:hypothetical protein [Acidimicrobiales bacterium]